MAVWYPPDGTLIIPSSSLTGEPLTSGEAIAARDSVTGAFQSTAAVTYLKYWTAATSGVSTGVTVYCGGTAASSVSLALISVYSVAASGNLTLAATTGNVGTTAFPTQSAAATVSWSGGNFTRVAGQLYALAIMAGAQGTMPTIEGFTTNTGTAALTGLAPYMTGSITQPTTYVTSGSNAAEISTIASWSSPSAGVLDVNSTSGFASGGGTLWVVVTAALAQITYTGVTGGNQFTGCAYVSGAATQNTFTFGTVQPVFPTTITAGTVVAGGPAPMAVVAP